MTQKKYKTPLQARTENNLASTHASRSKMRTPMTAARPRAASSDPIVPKFDPATPIAILRHARAGELAYSVKGSPIVASK
jgi:Cell division cycle-associated protein 8